MASKFQELMAKIAAHESRIRELGAVVRVEGRTLTDEESTELDAIEAELPGLKRARDLEETTRAEERSSVAISVHDNAADKPFANLGEQLLAIRSSALNPHAVDPRLVAIQAAATGASEGVASDGGFAVQHDFSTELLREVHQASAVAGRTRRITVGANSNGLKINGVDETSRVNGSRWGGVQAFWTAEAAAMTSSKPKYRQIDLELNDLTALYYATNNLIMDAAALGQAAGQAFVEELSFKVDDALFRGTGGGMPLGVIGHAGTVSISKETNQPAASVLKVNLEKMFVRHMNPDRAEWYINQDVWPALFALVAEVGVGGVPVFIPPGGLSAAPFGMIFGRPIVPVEFCESLGTVGDIIFADWSQYITIDKGGIDQADSIHVAFLTNEQVFRWVLRFDGQPIRNSALTPFKGTNTTAPFVTLATRA